MHNYYLNNKIQFAGDLRFPYRIYTCILEENRNFNFQRMEMQSSSKSRMILKDEHHCNVLKGSISHNLPFHRWKERQACNKSKKNIYIFKKILKNIYAYI